MCDYDELQLEMFPYLSLIGRSHSALALLICVEPTFEHWLDESTSLQAMD